MSNTQRLFSGAILIGGQARRLGGIAKGLLEFAGISIIEQLRAHLEVRCDDVFMVGDQKPEYTQVGLKIFPDILMHEGSPGGVVSALTHARHANVVIVACDMPGITGGALDKLMEEPLGSAVRMYSLDGRLEPMLGLWQRRCRFELENLLRQKNSGLRDLARQMDVESIEINDPNIVANLNSQSDVERWRNRRTGTSEKTC